MLGKILNFSNFSEVKSILLSFDGQWTLIIAQLMVLIATSLTIVSLMNALFEVIKVIEIGLFLSRCLRPPSHLFMSCEDL